MSLKCDLAHFLQLRTLARPLAPRCRPTTRRALGAAAAIVATSAGALSAQAPTPDTTTNDSLRTARIAAMRIEVARGTSTLDRVPWAVGTLRTEQIRRAQATVGIDEALANIPGVVVANRYNYALDQRVSIRGAGSRANFGLRGVKVLLDGVPQSLPDGQSQLTNVDLAAIARVEVLRGSASSLYGNGSGGVISFTTDLSAPDRLGVTLRQTAGSFGLLKTQARVSGRAGRGLGSLSLARTTVDGFRQYSAADTRQYLGAVDYALRDGVTLSLRGGTAETPKALNPGALTAVEYATNPDSAAAANVLRGASREVSQRYASLRLRGSGDHGEWSGVVYAQRRFVDNALAVAPPAPAGSTNGTFSTLDRRVTGARLDAARRLGDARLAFGLDLQRSFDVRRNQRATGGRPTAPEDTLLLDQNEVVTSVGPFAQVQWDPHTRVTASAGVRYDLLRFRVDDNFLRDGADNSGARDMTAASGHLGVVWRLHERFAPYANVSTAFETPTTTELQVRPDGQGGFNPELGPQRIRTMEAGARGQLGVRASYELALFQADANDAIVQFLETNGRAFFRNAGRTRSRGLEFGVNARLAAWLEAQAAWTIADYRFVDYILPLSGTTADTLDGNRLAGVPRQALRLGLRSRFGATTLDVDHSVQGAMFGDDRNLVPVKGWGRGQLNVRAAWTGRVGAWRAEPFVSVQNLLDERYIGAVTLNGFGGRVLEPAPGRNLYVGLELGAPLIR